MDIASEARKLALSKELPTAFHIEISEKKALELADKFPNADKLVVHVGICLMDIMLTEAMRDNKLSEHVPMSVTETKKFLRNYPLTDTDKVKIINCVEAHHQDVPFNCIEAEICANADCYKFIHPAGFFYYLTLLGERGLEFSKCLDQAEAKLDEKNKILSLQYCIDELSGYYVELKKYITEARKFIR